MGMVAKKKLNEVTREPKDLRYRKQHFPGADAAVFDTKRKGFVPLPIILRKVLWFLTPPEVRVLIYLSLRASKYGICYPTEEEIAHDLGMSGRKNLTPHLRSLERKNFIRTHTASGKKFFLIHDPRYAIERLAQSGELKESHLFDINDLLEDLGQEPVSTAQKKDAAKQP
jgi:DNA-binding MarR family transcriptional regulator